MTLARKVVESLSGGGFVSGEAMARDLRVTRAAISQVIAKLRSRGLEVHSVRGRGYRLVRPLEPLIPASVRAELSPYAARRVGEIEVVEQVDSTNRRLHQQLAAGRRVDVCLAEYQSAGRGRRGRFWLAAPYSSILMSLAHRLPGGPSASSGLSLAAGVAVARALEDCGCPGVGLKWPNDLLIGPAKLGGILVEIAGELGESCTCIVGVGLNVHLPPPLRSNCGRPATAIADHTRRPFSRNRGAAALISRLVETLDGFNRHGFAPYREEWEARHAQRGILVRVAAGDEVVSGTALGVSEDGALMVAQSDGAIRRVTTGEVMS